MRILRQSRPQRISGSECWSGLEDFADYSESVTCAETAGAALTSGPYSD
jgi:hypothetical protein